MAAGLTQVVVGSCPERAATIHPPKFFRKEYHVMAVRSAKAEWKGSLKGGKGTLETETGAANGAYTFASRFEEGEGTNPEELIAAAHAGCYSMALSGQLGGAGHEPESIRTTAKVHVGPVDGGMAITRIDLVTRATVPGLDEATFLQKAEAAKTGCPVSKALKAVEITLDAKLEG
jgi:osmotically inducible protein OsmC